MYVWRWRVVYVGCVQGLSMDQWMLSILISVMGLFWGRLPRVFPSLYKIAPEFGKREELLEETHSIALELRGRTPDRINERLGLASYTFAKKYAKKARLMTISRLRRRQSYPYVHGSSSSSAMSPRGGGRGVEERSDFTRGRRGRASIRQ